MKDATALKLVSLGMPLSAIVALLTTLPRGEFLQPSDPGFDAWTQTAGFEAWASGALNGTVWALFGILAWYALLGQGSRVAAWGTFLFATAMAVWLPITGIVAIAWPTIDPAASQAIMEHRTFVVWAAFATVSYVLGVACWTWHLRTRIAEAATFGLGALLLTYPFNVWQELAGALLYTVGTSLIVWRIWAIPQPATQSA